MSSPHITDRVLRPTNVGKETYISNLIDINKLAAAVKKAQAEGTGQPCDTAVILHLYYPDLWDEIRCFLANLGSDFDLYVSVCDTADDSTVERIKQHYPGAFVCKVENRGRDIGPFMEIYPVIAKYYRYICKIHSKKSLTHAGGDVWRFDLYNKLLGSPRRIAKIKALFKRAPHVGMIVAEGQLFSCQNFIYRNEEKVIDLAKRVGAKEPIDLDYSFPAGSMFWFRPDALTALLGLNIRQASFELEQGQDDGTLAHAMERVFPLAATVAGYQIVDTRRLSSFWGRNLTRLLRWIIKMGRKCLNQRAG